MVPETRREWLRCLCRHDKKFSLRPQQEMAALVNHWDLQIIFSYAHPFCCIHDSVQHKHHSFYRTLRIVYNCSSSKESSKSFELTTYSDANWLKTNVDLSGVNSQFSYEMARWELAWYKREAHHRHHIINKQFIINKTSWIITSRNLAPGSTG